MGGRAVDRPNPNVFQTPQPAGPVPEPVAPEPDIDPAGGAAPTRAADPGDWGTAPMGGGVPPMTTPRSPPRFHAWASRQDGRIGDGRPPGGYRIGVSRR